MQNQQQPAAVQNEWTPAFDRNQIVMPELASACAAWTAYVPAAASTVLTLDLLLQNPSLDLQAASDIVLSDLGATLQVLRLARAQQNANTVSPARMEDCLANLDADVWFAAIAEQTISRSSNAAQLHAVWQHSRLIAQYASVLAESFDGIAPETAYLVGLLHEIETVSLLLGEDSSTAASSETFPLENVVPAEVLEALASAKDRDSNSAWRYILSSAHALASAVPQFVSPAGRAAN